MATTYRKSKVEKFQKHLQHSLNTMEKNLESLKMEGVLDGYTSLLTKYNMLFDVLLDYCLEFDLEPPLYPSEKVFPDFNDKGNRMRRETMEHLNQLANEHAFLELDAPELQDFDKLLTSIDLNEFFMHCNLNPTLKYGQSVHRACRQATMYFLYAVTQKLQFGKYLLKSIAVIDGFVGETPHTWIQLGDTHYLDMTLAQFTTEDIPSVAILPIEKANDLYQIQHRFTWETWVQLESDLLSDNR